jgi:hypothetical protein
LTRRLEGAILCSIVFIYIGFASLWATRIPVFAPPDEIAHADYMFAFFDAGNFYKIHTTKRDSAVLPETRYLEKETGYRAIRYNPLARVPPGYGTAQYVAALNAGAPERTGMALPNGSAIPYAMFFYPATYYLLLAKVVLLVIGGKSHSLAQAFIIARLLNVALGAASLCLAFSAFRSRGVSVVTSSVATLAIATLPLYCWVTSYIQPDNLVLFFVGFVVWAATRTGWSAELLSVGICGLVLTKPFYGVAVWIPVLVYSLSSLSPRNAKINAVALLGVIPSLALVLSFHFTPAASGLVDASHSVASSTSQLLSLSTASSIFVSVLNSIFLGGRVFQNYWFGYGIHGYYLSPTLTSYLSVIFLFASASATLGYAYLFARRLVRIARIARNGHFKKAFRLIGRGLSVNIYLAYCVVLIGTSVAAGSASFLQARYFLPLLVPLVLILLTDVPRVLSPRVRQHAHLGFASALLLMSLPLTLTAPHAIQRDYYAATNTRPDYDFGGVVVNGTGDAASFAAQQASVHRGDVVTIRGFALDVVSGLPADRISIVSDGHSIGLATRQEWSVAPEADYHDSILQQAGFIAVIPAARFGIGRHEISVVASRRGSPSLPLHHHVELTVNVS